MSTGTIIVSQDQQKGGNSNSIAVIQDHYGDLVQDEEDQKHLRMNTQPKSEQKFRSQTNENINRNKKFDPNMVVASNTITNRGTSNPATGNKRGNNQMLERTIGQGQGKLNQSHMMPEQMSKMLQSSFVSSQPHQNHQNNISL